jgi:hypothetical protein
VRFAKIGDRPRLRHIFAHAVNVFLAAGRSAAYGLGRFFIKIVVLGRLIGERIHWHKFCSSVDRVNPFAQRCDHGRKDKKVYAGSSIWRKGKNGTSMKESTYKGIVFLFGLLLLGVVALWLYSRFSEIRTAAIERKKAETAAYIKSRVSAMVDPAVFDGGDFIRQRKVFQSFFDTIRSRQLAGIKVWDRDMTVLWSNLGQLNGQRFPENHEVRKALDGEIEFGVGGQYAEHLTGRQFYELSSELLTWSGHKLSPFSFSRETLRRNNSSEVWFRGTQCLSY